jgi:adenosylhomocysteine nucleosidase
MIRRIAHPEGDTLIVTALEAELPTFWGGPVLFTSVGKVCAATALSKYLAQHPNIKRVINYGTAGGIKGVTKGQVYPINKFVESDFRSCSLNLPHRDMIAFDSWLSDVDHLCASTQDHFVTDPTELDDVPFGREVNVVDMESYALAYVCQQFGVQFMCYKYISDDADESAATEWVENVHGGEEQFVKLLLTHHKFESK